MRDESDALPTVNLDSNFFPPEPLNNSVSLIKFITYTLIFLNIVFLIENNTEY